MRVNSIHVQYSMYIWPALVINHEKILTPRFPTIVSMIHVHVHAVYLLTSRIVHYRHASHPGVSNFGDPYLWPLNITCMHLVPSIARFRSTFSQTWTYCQAIHVSCKLKCDWGEDRGSGTLLGLGVGRTLYSSRGRLKRSAAVIHWGGGGGEGGE